MEEMQMKYNGEFTIEERKLMTAQALQELRKAKKLSQKEVAAYLNIPATTYNTYESGRTEPPIEILVRLSHLYGVPIDVIVQRDRTFTTAEEFSKQLTAFRDQLVQMENQVETQGTNVTVPPEFVTAMSQLANAMTAYAQTEAAQKALNQATQRTLNQGAQKALTKGTQE